MIQRANEARGKKAISLLCALGFCAALLAGCSGEGGAAQSGTASTSALVPATTADVVTETAADASTFDFEYTDRDKDASYDEATATRIALNGTSITAEGSGVSIAGSEATITEAGTYIVAGTLTDGSLSVDLADENAKVQIVLDGASIHNEDGPAIHIKAADKAFITLAEGSKNTLTDGSAYTLEEGSDEPYATLFSKADLTLNGSGALEVESSYRHAVCSKDDLVITGGVYTIDAAEDALRGRDCVKICAGEFDIVAVGDGIKSNNDEDATRGFVSIDGGDFSIVAGDDGIQAVTLLRVMEGAIVIDAADDALHSDTEALIAGGTLTIEAGDDAVHAETQLLVSGGTVDVKSCFEGYEAEKIYINGGETRIVASDDAINAAAAEVAGTGEESANEFQSQGGMPMTGMAEGGFGMGDENCLLQINGGYTVVEAGGDGLDSNGYIEMNGGVMLVTGPTDNGNGAFDYDLSATVSGGTLIAVGSTGMAQNFTSGTQAFSFTNVQGQAGANVAITDESGAVIASYTPTKQYGMVLVTAPSLAEGGSYNLVIGGTPTDMNADGYASGGTVSGGNTTTVTASTTATGGMGGLGADGMGQAPGMQGAPGGPGGQGQGAQGGRGR